MSIVKEADFFVNNLLNEGLTDAHRYHSRLHTLQVRDMALSLGRELRLPEEDLEALELAALFHDTGFTVRYEDNEVEGAALAESFLSAQGYPEERRALVGQLIKATAPDVQPDTLLEKVLCDADLSHLGSADYLATLQELRYEWEVLRHQHYADAEWYRLNHGFLKRHTFHTAVAQTRLGPQADENRRALKKLRDSLEKAGKDDKTAKPGSITESKSAQMMFKTALRNHIDLSNLADNKANIMLSVTALIITIVIPTAAASLGTRPYLLPPLVSLLITCLSAMIFATLATRPIPMTGRTDTDKVKAGQANLFFFGNFYKMRLDDYLSNMDHVVGDPKILESSIMRDLYFLGKSLGRKYTQLRICYNVFMLGITVTVVVYAVSYWVLG